MLQIHVILCCKYMDYMLTSTVLVLGAPAGAFFPQENIIILWEDNIADFVLETNKIPVKSMVLGLSAPAGAFFPQKKTLLFLRRQCSCFCVLGTDKIPQFVRQALKSIIY